MKLLKKLIIMVIIIIISAIAVITFLGYQKYKNAINQIPLEQKIVGIESQKSFIEMEKIPAEYFEAVVAVEDHRFYEHGATDFISIIRAIFNNLKERELSEGGSTITQQLAKNLYFSQDRDILRKIAEVFVAMDLEKEYSKKKILELYVNTCYYGDGYYGIKDACKGYFKKEPIEMSLYEETLLAGVPNAPSVYAPTKNLELATKRQRHVINKMVEYGKLTKEMADSIIGDN